MNIKTYTVSTWKAFNTSTQNEVLKVSNVQLTLNGVVVQIIMGYNVPAVPYGGTTYAGTK